MVARSLFRSSFLTHSSAVNSYFFVRFIPNRFVHFPQIRPRSILSTNFFCLIWSESIRTFPYILSKSIRSFNLILPKLIGTFCLIRSKSIRTFGRISCKSVRTFARIHQFFVEYVRMHRDCNTSLVRITWFPNCVYSAGHGTRNRSLSSY